MKNFKNGEANSQVSDRLQCNKFHLKKTKSL